MDAVDVMADWNLWTAWLGIFAGMRTAEAGAAQWSWFDFEHGTITIQGDAAGEFKTKSSKFRSLPFHDRLKKILEPYRQAEGFLIIGLDTDSDRVSAHQEAGRNVILGDAAHFEA